jgi:prepilin-type N-terminal cleavage/methylation domain-containing protein
MKKQAGFTLIELLVVIALIGILASVILVSLNSARGKARDAYRVSSIIELQKAVELYYNDYGAYPVQGSWGGTCSEFGSYGVTGASGYIPNLAPTYIPTLPVDPKPIGTYGCIIYTSNGTDYALMTHQTYEGTVPPSRVRPLAPNQQDYFVSTPGYVNQ